MDDTERATLLEQALLEASHGVLITKYVVIVELIDADGDKALETITSDMSVWDEMGMLKFQLAWRERTLDA